ncbi:uncharacterized protein LOC136024906 isoform X2 [Artemia franciscana]|uniref:uncharacterized protein LOC136024906 isoform X2 n=1 Tax=Artemia franciscana TaxID=6661 RepID=UPI0032DBAD76
MDIYYGGNWTKAHTSSSKKFENAKKLILEAENAYRINANRQQFIKKVINICLSYLIDSLHRVRTLTTSQEFIKLITSMRCFEEETEITDEILETVQQAGILGDTDDEDDEVYRVGDSQFIRDVPMKLRYIPSRSSLNSSFTSMSEVALNKLDVNEVVSNEFVKVESSEPARKIEDVESFENLLSEGFLSQEGYVEEDNKHCSFQRTECPSSPFDVALMDRESVLAFPVSTSHKDATTNVPRNISVGQETSAGQTTEMSEDTSRELDKSLSTQLYYSTEYTNMKIGVDDAKESKENGKEKIDENINNESQRMSEDLDMLEQDVKRGCRNPENRGENVDSAKEIIDDSDTNSSPRKDKRKCMSKGKIFQFLDKSIDKEVKTNEILKIRIQRSDSSESRLERSRSEKMRKGKVINLKEINKHSEKKNENVKEGKFSLKKKKKDVLLDILEGSEESELERSSNKMTHSDELGVSSRKKKRDAFAFIFESPDENELVPSVGENNKDRDLNRIDVRFEKENDKSKKKSVKKKRDVFDFIFESPDENELVPSVSENNKDRDMNRIGVRFEKENDKSKKKRDVFDFIFESHDENNLVPSVSENTKVRDLDRIDAHFENKNDKSKKKSGKKKRDVFDFIFESPDENELVPSVGENNKDRDLNKIDVRFENENDKSKKKSVKEKRDVFDFIFESHDENDLVPSVSENNKDRDLNRIGVRFEKENDKSKKKRDVFDFIFESHDENDLVPSVSENTKVRDLDRIDAHCENKNDKSKKKSGKKKKDVFDFIFESPDENELAPSISENNKNRHLKRINALLEKKNDKPGCCSVIKQCEKKTTKKEKGFGFSNDIKNTTEDSRQSTTIELRCRGVGMETKLNAGRKVKKRQSSFFELLEETAKEEGSETEVRISSEGKHSLKKAKRHKTDRKEYDEKSKVLQPLKNNKRSLASVSCKLTKEEPNDEGAEESDDEVLLKESNIKIMNIGCSNSMDSHFKYKDKNKIRNFNDYFVSGDGSDEIDSENEVTHPAQHRVTCQGVSTGVSWSNRKKTMNFQKILEDDSNEDKYDYNHSREFNPNQHKPINACRRIKSKKTMHSKKKKQETICFESTDSTISSVDLSSQIIYAINSQEFQNDECIEGSGSLWKNKNDDKLINNVFLELPGNIPNTSKKRKGMICCDVENKLEKGHIGNGKKLKRKNVKIAKGRKVIARKKITNKRRPFTVSHTGSTWVVNTIDGETPNIQKLEPSTLNSSPRKVDIGLSPIKSQESENLEYPLLAYVMCPSPQSYVRPTPDSSLCGEPFATSTQTGVSNLHKNYEGTTSNCNNVLGSLFALSNLAKSSSPDCSSYAIDDSSDKVSKDKKSETLVALENNETYLVCSNQTPTVHLTQDGSVRGLEDQNNLKSSKLNVSDKYCVPDSRTSISQPSNCFENQSEDNESDVEFHEQCRILSSFEQNFVNMRTSVFHEDERLKSLTLSCASSEMKDARSPRNFSFSPKHSNDSAFQNLNKESQVILGEISPQIPLQTNEGVRNVPVRDDNEKSKDDSETPDLCMDNGFSCFEIIHGEKDKDGDETPDDLQTNNEALPIDEYISNEGDYSINQDKSGQRIYCRFSCSETTQGEIDKNNDDIPNNLAINDEVLSKEKYLPIEEDDSTNQGKSGQNRNNVTHLEDYNPIKKSICPKNCVDESHSFAKASIGHEKTVPNHKNLSEYPKADVCLSSEDNRYEMEERCGKDEAGSHAYKQCTPTEMKERCANKNQSSFNKNTKNICEPEILLEDHGADLGTSYCPELTADKDISSNIGIVLCEETTPDLRLVIDDTSGNLEPANISASNILSCNDSNQRKDVSQIHIDESVKVNNIGEENDSSIVFIDLCKDSNSTSESEGDKIYFISRTPSKDYDVSMSKEKPTSSHSFRAKTDSVSVGSVGSAGNSVEISEDLKTKRTIMLNPSRLAPIDDNVSVSKTKPKHSCRQKDDFGRVRCNISTVSSVEVFEDSSSKSGDKEIISANKVSANNSLKEVEAYETMGCDNIKDKTGANEIVSNYGDFEDGPSEITSRPLKRIEINSNRKPSELIQLCTSLCQNKGRPLSDKVSSQIKKRKRAKKRALHNEISNDLKHIGADIALLHQEDSNELVKLPQKNDHSEAIQCETSSLMPDTNITDYDCIPSRSYETSVRQCQERTFNTESVSDCLSLQKKKNQIRKIKKRRKLLSSDELVVNSPNILKKKGSVETLSAREEFNKAGKIGEVKSKNQNKTTISVNSNDAAEASLSSNFKEEEDAGNLWSNSTTVSTNLSCSKKKINKLSGIVNVESDKKGNMDCSRNKNKGNLSKTERLTLEHLTSTIQDGKRKERINKKYKKNRNCHTSKRFKSTNSQAVAEESVVRKLVWEISELGTYDSHPSRNFQLVEKSDKTSAECKFIVSDNFNGSQNSRAKFYPSESQWTTIKSKKSKISDSQLTNTDESAQRYGFIVNQGEACTNICNEDSCAIDDVIKAANVNDSSRSKALAEIVNSLNTVSKCGDAEREPIAAVKPTLNDRVSNKTWKKQKAKPRSCGASLTDISPIRYQTLSYEGSISTKNQKAEVSSCDGSLMDVSPNRSQTLSHDESISNKNLKKQQPKAKSRGNSLIKFSPNRSQTHDESTLIGIENPCFDAKVLFKYKKLKVHANARLTKRLNCTMPLPSRNRDDRIKSAMKGAEKNYASMQNNESNSLTKSRRLSRDVNSGRNLGLIDQERNYRNNKLALSSPQSVPFVPPKKKLFSPWLDKLNSPESSPNPIASTPYQKFSNSPINTKLSDISDIPLTKKKRRGDSSNGTSRLSLKNDTR